MEKLQQAESKKALIIFTRVPEPGKTKTRLMPYFTPKQCAKLHTCFLKDIAKMCGELEEDVFICHTPQDEKQILHTIFGTKAEYFLQSESGLGERMFEAIDFVLKKGYEACVLIGTDVPEVDSRDIRQAFELLETKEVVFAPVVDGGYYLVGMKEAKREVFEQKTYGHGNVLHDTMTGLQNCGITVGLLDEKNDIDTREDIVRFRERMRKNKQLQHSETGKYLMRTGKISIILPIYNEEKTIQKMVKQLESLKNKCEILFVDGGSTDRTLEYIGEEYTVLHCEKGRGRQMNLGAKKSTGDILFFLHCDSELPEKPLEQIRTVMKDYRFGCFGIAFHSKNFFMFTCRVISNHRIKDRKVVFGDQGIFIDRDLFFEVGMFPEIPLMEDYQFSLTLKERGEKIGITKNRIYTSDRRFPKGTIPKLKEMWKMNRLRKKYRDGVDIQTISKMYDDVR